MTEHENKGSVQHTPAEWTSSNHDQYANADKARYHSEKVTEGNIVFRFTIVFYCRSATKPYSSSLTHSVKQQGNVIEFQFCLF